MVEQLRCFPDHEEHETRDSSKTWQSCYPKKTITHEDNDKRVSRDVYRVGSDRFKPPVILLHELDGPSAKTFEYAESLSIDFTVYVPVFFGDLNRSSWINGLGEVLFNGEWGRPFSGPILNNKTPIVNWLQHVTLEVEREHPGSFIGVIGNCLTGSLPLLLLNNPSVNAIVLAQPTLPIRFTHYSDYDRSSLGISETELIDAKRAVNERNIKIYGVRFENDCLSKPEKQTTLKREFGNRYIDGTISNSECETGNCGKAHSTLIGEWKLEQNNPSNERREEVLKYLKSRLTSPKSSISSAD